MFLIIWSGKSEKEFSLSNYYTGEYICYTSTPTSEESINLGAYYLNRNKTKNVKGESVKIENFEPASAIEELNAKVVKTECLENGATIIYCYTNKIPTSINLFNQKVNLQIAHYADYSVIGWPLILGSF